MSVLAQISMWIGLALAILFTVMYAHQMFYLIVGLFTQPKLKKKEFKKHKYAVIISARNEEMVIGNLIDTIKAQKYPQDLIEIIVGVDNSTDNTVEIAREKGAIVLERKETKEKGKGQSLEYIFGYILENLQDKNYDAFLVLDADNLLEENYVEELNKVFDSGYEVVTTYRNSKNFCQNWISSGYSVWFLRESRYLNGPRMTLKTSCAISGTGWAVSKRLIEENGGWKCKLLTEDIEFTTDYVLKGGKIGYAKDAMLYDEQPYTFKQSWNQRMRWAKGFYQVVSKNGGKLFKGFFKKNGFSCYDMLTTIAPALLISLAMCAVNLVFAIIGLCMWDLELLKVAGLTLLSQIGYFYFWLFVVGTLAVFSEWKKINAPWWKKIITLFTFPLFMFTYFPIAVVALFKKVSWVPIKHDQQVTLNEVKKSKVVQMPKPEEENDENSKINESEKNNKKEKIANG